MARAGLGGAAGFGAVLGSQYVEEGAQAGLDRYAQDVALEMSGIAPDTDWPGFFHDWITAAKPEQRDALAAVTFYALIGGAGASFSHFRQGKALQQNRAFLHGLGIPEASIREITGAKDTAAAEDAYLSERHAMKIKRHEKGSIAWKRASPTPFWSRSCGSPRQAGTCRKAGSARRF